VFQNPKHPGQCFTSKVAGFDPQLPGWFCPQIDKSALLGPFLLAVNFWLLGLGHLGRAFLWSSSAEALWGNIQENSRRVVELTRRMSNCSAKVSRFGLSISEFPDQPGLGHSLHSSANLLGARTLLAIVAASS
jgi:hypothetical protein